MLPFALLLIYLIFQFRFVYLYHDDYGYASLGYGISLHGVPGTDFTPAQAFEYLKEHFETVNGRNFIVHLAVLPHLWLARLTMVIAIPAAYYMLYRLLGRKSGVAAAFLCLSFGFFPREAYRVGFYWFSASLSYVLPLVAVFASAWAIMAVRGRTVRHPRLVLLLACAGLFASATFHEQIGLSVAAFTGLLALWRVWKERRVAKRDLALFIAAVAGAAVVVMSPGTLNRQDSVADVGLFQLAKQNAVELFSVAYNFSWAVPVTLALTTALVGWLNFRAGRCRMRTLVALGAAGIVFLAALTHPGSIWTECYGAVYSAVALVVIVRYLLVVGRTELAMLFVGSVLTVGALLFFSPYMVARVLILPELCLFAAGALVISQVAAPAWAKWTSVGLVGVYCLIAMVSMTQGYARNAPILETWHRELTKMHELAKQAPPDTPLGPLVLPSYADMRYAADAPDYTAFYLRDYYDIPSEVEVIIPPPPPGTPLL
ncbi:MAG: DUF6056 family protein [Bifidobacteriaceae bacterium]|jgi:hypothetical protein|nr:DUF6056 family protein [Bifidobacteriaceae bacterium]